MRSKKGIAITGTVVIAVVVLLILIFSGALSGAFKLTKTLGDVAGFLGEVPIWVWVVFVVLLLIKSAGDD